MSKRILQHPERALDNHTKSWGSLDQLENTPAYRGWVEREFPEGAGAPLTEEQRETSRRSFLKLMGAAAAMATAACRRPESYIVPYAKAPEWVIPGVATYYATSMPRGGGAVPVVVTSFEGRPTKLAPNVLHPGQVGTDAIAQATVLDLYSPSRSKVVLKRGVPVKMEEFAKNLATLSQEVSRKWAIVVGDDDSPSRQRLLKKFQAKFAGSKIYRYEPLIGEAEKALGLGVSLIPDFAKADRVLSLDCDFLGLDGSYSTAEFSARRTPEGGDYKGKADVKRMNRLYAVESVFSVTGGLSDHRLRVAPSQVYAVLSQLASYLGLGGNGSALKNDKQVKWVLEMAQDLKENAGRTAILVGSRQPEEVHQLALAVNLALGNIGEGKALQAYQTGRQGESVERLVGDLNAGVVDSVLFLTPANPVYDAPADLKFADALAKAKVSIHLGERTTATAFASTWHIPAAHYLESWLDSRTARGVYTVVQPMILPLYADCVGELELLAAFLDGKGELIHGEGKDGGLTPAYQAVRDTFSELSGDSSLSRWKSFLKYGFLENSAYSLAQPTAKAVNRAISPEPTLDQLEVIFATSSSVYDGRWIDNAWMQEAPDPVTKLTWDNAALISPKTAKNLGIYDQIIPLEKTTQFGDLKLNNAGEHPDGESGNRKAPLIRLSVNGVVQEYPVLVSFGLAENVIVVALGYGQGFDKEDELGRDTKNQAHVGLVGVNRGFDAYLQRTTKSLYFAQGAKVEKTSKRYSLAITQEHDSMYGRSLAREISTVADAEKGDFEAQLHNVKKQGMDSHAPENVSLYKSQGKNGETLLTDKLHQWEMSIDLSSCSGCNACLVACQAENNIPVVGKRQVALGRRMHWIRMDRYFAVDESNDFDADSPEMIPQPVACVQCESAPCETVCPVNATVHTEDGLNAMAYNRCIGTRYCANNCPYKARRFNYFDYNKRNPLINHNLYRGPFGEKQVGEAPHLQRNPNVTVRMRGVMEKCTYCVQRLKDAVVRQKRGQKQDVLASGKLSPEVAVSETRLRIPVDSVRVACQEACASGAISFGNQLDGEKGRVGRAKRSLRNYDLLQYLGTRPRTSYLARVKNPNPRMPDAAFMGKATIDSNA